MSGRWVLSSGGVRLLVDGPDHLAAWWPRLLASIPSGTVVSSDLPAWVGTDAVADRLTIAAATTPADLRRLVNAHLHAAHLHQRVLSLHGVAVADADRGVLLLGGHGAGKSLTGLAMLTGYGWSIAAADTCLIRVPVGEPPQLLGGTGTYLVDGEAVTRWFPHLAGPSAAVGRCDLAEHPGLGPLAAWSAGVEVATVVWVQFDSGTPSASWGRLDDQVAVSAVYRASGYLLTKVLDDEAAEPLVLVENAALTAERLRLARHLGGRLGCWWIRGNPHQIADVVDRLARKGDLP